MKTIDEKQIQSLLDKFMEGETTIDEEKILGEYFRSTKNVKAEWEAYKSMFGYFDEGMPYEEAADEGMPYNEPAEKATRHNKVIKMIVGAVSAAAIVALLFTFALPKGEDSKQLTANNEPKKEVPAKTKVKAAKKDTSKEEAEEPSIKEEKKAETPAPKKAKKRVPRLNYGIPAPKEYMAETEKSDTLDIVDKELINNYIYQCASMDFAMEEIYTQEMSDEQEYITNE